MRNITLAIDGQPVSVTPGTTILEATRLLGKKIPTLCYLENVQAIGACRVCLVEVEGAKALVSSCVMPVSEGMKVLTNTRRVREARRTVVELLLSDHEGDCQTCDRNEDCELQAIARELGIRKVSFPGEKSRSMKDDSTPALQRDTAKCILCRRCVTVCNEVQAVG
ncbi:MAG: 2Fe-2S iron-sulfur cluster binding domain-containing protein, partial [Planctomycetes bacterium]|nr:2Fe-2S iron-sulfur cluster binding domain-containing protein [Planctomycetota bacterium]